MGTATMRFSEGIIISGSTTVSPYGVQLYVSGNLNLNSASEPFMQFQVANEDRAKISINTSNNLVLHNQYINKHIVMKVNDQGTTREGLRIDGAVPEVVVNEGSESLVDFRVESNSQTHMLFVDGGNNKVGVGTASPSATLHVYADVSNSYAAIIDNDQGSAGHGLKVTSDASGTGGFLLDVESQSTTFFRVRADQKVGIGNISAMPATLSVKGTSNSVPVVNIKNSADAVVFSINSAGELVALGSDSPSSDQVLTWDGSKAVWENASGEGGSGDNLSLTALKTSNYTAANWEMVLVNLVGASGDVTVTLPAASSNKQIAVKIAGLASGKEVIVDGNSSETIDGLATRIMNTDYESVHLISDGNNWWRIS